MGTSSSASFQRARKSRYASFALAAGESVGPAQLQVCQCARRKILNDAPMVKQFLELGGGAAVVCQQVSLAAQISWVECSELRRGWLAQFVWSCSFQKYQSLGRIAAVQFNRCLEYG